MSLITWDPNGKAWPKSQIRNLKSFPINTLSNFISRWACWAFKCRLCIPLQICRNRYFNKSSSCIPSQHATKSKRLPFSHNSVLMQTALLVKYLSNFLEFSDSFFTSFSDSYQTLSKDLASWYSSTFRTFGSSLSYERISNSLKG